LWQPIASAVAAHTRACKWCVLRMDAPLPIAHLTRRTGLVFRALRREAVLGRGVLSTRVLACGAAHFLFWRVGMSYLATRKQPLALLVTRRLLSQPTQIA
jgi:hypothetical protein